MESLELSKKYKFFLLLECVLIISFLVIYFNFIFSFLLSSSQATGHLYGYETSAYHLILITISLVIISFIFIFAVLTLQEYKKCIARRAYILNGKSNLSLTEILENENRLNVLMEILENPGIHQNELLRNCALQKGQLQWHLAILLKNGIIKKEK
ncbi:MAG: winged helix-turn-helix transcriptional regulator, partial [Candidatus Odinarchaeota archaeon]